MSSIYRRTWKTAAGQERIRFVVAYRDQHGARHNKSFFTRKAAVQWRTLTDGEVIQGTHLPESVSITVAEAADLWLKRAELEGLERSTIRQYRIHSQQHIVPLIGPVKLARLSTPVVQAFRDKLLENRSRALSRKILASLKSIIGEAARRGLVAQNTAQPVSIDTRKREQGKLTVGVDVPSKDEIAALLDHAQGRWRPFFVTAIFTGMRASELRGLPWSAVDLDKRVIHVRQRADAWGTIGAPKSAAGNRAIPMAPVVVNALREWQLQCPKSELGLVFPTGTGKVESHANIAARGFNPLQRAALGEVRYNLHSLRHFAASLWIELGFSPKRLQVMLGHSSVQMSFDTYGHLLSDAENSHGRFTAGENLIRAARVVAGAA